MRVNILEKKNEIQRVFNDLMRLAYMKNENNNCLCFFIMCGETEDYCTNFKRIVDGRKSKKSLPSYSNDQQKDEPIGQYSEWFCFKKGEEKAIQIEGEFLNSFLKDYFEEGQATHPPFSSIRTKLLEYLPLTNQTDQTQTVSIWEVSSNQL